MVLYGSPLLVPLLALAAAAPMEVITRYSEVAGRPYALSRDGRSLVINGTKRVLLLSGSIHYMRSTPAQWPHLFAEARASGLNAVESYVFWNAHAPTRDGPYDYAFNKNVTRFLELAAAADLFVLWRFGPYVCAEWPAGGIPAWIEAVPGMRTRTNNTAWLDETGRWMEAHFAHIARFLPGNGGPVIASQIENEYAGSGPAAEAYVAALGTLAAGVAPGLTWMMCGHVTTVAAGALHTGNGCPHDLGPAAAPLERPVAGSPAWYTEDEMWFDSRGAPGRSRPPADVAYGVASYLATGGSMHNYYMFHGGNHYGNWSTEDPTALPIRSGGPSSAENTVRYANGALLRSDGARREPAFSLAAAVHGTFRDYAAALLLAAPSALTAPVCVGAECPHVYFLRFANGTRGVTFGIHACGQWNACGDATATVRASGFLPFVGDAALPVGSVVAWDDAGAVLFNTSAVPPIATAPVECGGSLEWETWTDGGETWFRAPWRPPPSEGAALLDLAGLARGRVFLDGVHVTNYDVASIADCTDRGKPRCGSAKAAGAYAGVALDPNAPGDGDCGSPSQRYYHVYPEAAERATSILIAQDKGAGGNASRVRVCARALGAPP